MKKLSREQMKMVVGGVNQRSDCAYYSPHGSATGGPVATYNVSMADAQAGAANGGGNWCCDSCGSATWYGI